MNEMRSSFDWAVFLLALLLSGCSLLGEESQMAEGDTEGQGGLGVFVSGLVVSSETGLPLRRVQVDLGKVGLTDGQRMRLYYTDGEGRFSINYECERGWYYVFVWGDASHWGSYMEGNSDANDEWFECTRRKYDVVIKLEPKPMDRMSGPSMVLIPEK